MSCPVQEGERKKSVARVPILEGEVGGIRHLFRVEAICGKETGRSQDWDDPGWTLEDHHDHSNRMKVASLVDNASRGRGVHV